MREALAIASAEGLESMWARHRALHLHLWEGLREMGLEPFVEKEQYRLVSVNTIKVQCSLACHCIHGQLQSLHRLSDCLALYSLHDERS